MNMKGNCEIKYKVRRVCLPSSSPLLTVSLGPNLKVCYSLVPPFGYQLQDPHSPNNSTTPSDSVSSEEH